ncbi:histone deacetylase [Luteipulveratus sp. YIM 133132]|uniref:Histone deacetylase n=1 Tax=Luteipulveratus flavus TaxID=3031728 RepID=A0ABT6C4P4_9MICO|nr:MULTISPECIES: histone deacetylase [unclassified Luteipulveratus]MDE9367832.1 histone deacetylase [Luteipulveratus sp. YIM 133132]MDF8263760.1 histone deacetylase [Luteipulveratus sp. YIM 133296]
MTTHVWYAAYGSNLSEQRFAHYLCGGRPLGANRIYPGARDRRPASDSRPVRLRGGIFFGWESPTWGGGVAFLDPRGPGEALARAYRITREQLSDLHSQEMHREPGDDLAWELLHRDGQLVLGDGRYETVMLAGRVADEPLVTFTCPDGPGRPDVNAPSATYLQLVARGLGETHRLAEPEIVDYLAGCPGVSGRWSGDELTAAVAAGLG